MSSLGRPPQGKSCHVGAPRLEPGSAQGGMISLQLQCRAMCGRRHSLAWPKPAMPLRYAGMVPGGSTLQYEVRCSDGSGLGLRFAADAAAGVRWCCCSSPDVFDRQGLHMATERLGFRLLRLSPRPRCAHAVRCYAR